MSKEIADALKNCVNEFHRLTQKQENGEYNFYLDHFRREGKSIDNAIEDLIEDHTGFFEEFAFVQMRDESLALLRAIYQAEYYVTWQAYYDPSKVFKTREEYLIDAQKRAREAQAKLTEYYHKLATYYNDKERFFNSPEAQTYTTDY
jgi:hypothetical protein